MNTRPHIFTLEEANQLLPELDSRLALLAHKKEAYARRHDELLMAELLSQAEKDNGVADQEQNIDDGFRALESALEDFERDLTLFHELGCVLRDIENGCIDFPGKVDGKMVYFCWRRGEQTISHYRSLQDETLRRLPVNKL
ncbi:MAG: DUF2203 family protein [Candidatus Omnitrophota bacterium]|nr:DUF2203 family protein [Candidatus Omnitrophota bacterium]